LGGGIVATDIYLIRDVGGFEIFTRSYPEVWRGLLIPISSAWLLITLAVLLAVYVYHSHTERGYRSRYRFVLPILGSSAILVGVLISVIGYDGTGHQYVSGYVPVYRDWHINNKRSVWMHPEAGLLTGVLSQTPSGTMVVLTDYAGYRWNISFASNTLWENGATSATGVPVRLTGIEVQPTVFVANSVRPFSELVQ
jgi:hypothetical protein